jgi:hypothetical protein
MASTRIGFNKNNPHDWAHIFNLEEILALKPSDTIKAQLNKQVHEGWTALHFLALDAASDHIQRNPEELDNYVELALKLIELGADPFIREKPSTDDPPRTAYEIVKENFPTSRVAEALNPARLVAQSVIEQVLGTVFKETRDDSTAHTSRRRWRPGGRDDGESKYDRSDEGRGVGGRGRS